MTKVDDRANTITVEGDNGETESVNASVFADSFKKVAVVETKWLRHDRARDLLGTEENSEELLKPR